MTNSFRDARCCTPVDGEAAGVAKLLPQGSTGKWCLDFTVDVSEEILGASTSRTSLRTANCFSIAAESTAGTMEIRSAESSRTLRLQSLFTISETRLRRPMF